LDGRQWLAGDAGLRQRGQNGRKRHRWWRLGQAIALSFKRPNCGKDLFKQIAFGSDRGLGTRFFRHIPQLSLQLGPPFFECGLKVPLPEFPVPQSRIQSLHHLQST
jgi:hypothetical protein